MESIQQIKNRINSIIGTRQITQSMRLVSTVRMRAVRDRMRANAPFLDATVRMALEAAKEPDVFDHPYVRGLRAYGANGGDPAVDYGADGYGTDGYEADGYGADGERKRTGAKCVVVIGSDRGLCGGYNINVYREARALIHGLGEVRLITVGQKIKDFFAQRGQGGFEIIKSFTGISETPFFEDAEEIAKTALDLYNGGGADAIYTVHTRFVNMLTHVPAQTLLLPYGAAAGSYGGENEAAGPYGETGAAGADAGGTNGIGAGRDAGTGAGSSVGSGAETDASAAAGGRRVDALTRYEPDCADFLSQSTPFYIAAVLFGAILEASVCEQCSRTISMDTAVKNSDEMINTLTLRYNKARQNAITTELADIIGGTRALRQNP